MSINRREEVLARVFAILEGIDGFATKARNRGLLDNDALPGVVLLDGDETSTKLADGRGRQRMSPVVASMHPQVFVLLKTKQPTNQDVGQNLNAFRGEIIRAISGDAQLIALIGPNGDITYDGCETDLKSGGAMVGEMRLDFTIKTVMNPNA
jgi:hypothetical protein